MKDRTSIAVLSIAGIFVALMLGGWIANIYKLAHAEFIWSGMQILRIVGIFLASLGAILGFL